MRIQINGEAREVEDDLHLSGLVIILSLRPEQIAIELNKQVVRRAQWVDTLLREGDQVEIVHFVGGGGLSADYADSEMTARRCLHFENSRTNCRI